MPKVEEHRVGTFCWTDLPTNDVEAARAFYTELFGWNAEEVPMPEGRYVVFQKADEAVAATYAMTDQMREQGVPPHWESFARVESADASAANVSELGGKVIAPPFDVPGVGRFAVVADPHGAMFNLYEFGGETGAGLVNETGALCWNELYAKDCAEVAPFYEGVLGYEIDKTSGADGQPYYQFKLDGQPVAGGMNIRAEWGPMPPNWMVYYAVENLDDTLARAAGLGAKTEMPPTEIPNIGRFALLSDPQGARFFVIQISART